MSLSSDDDSILAGKAGELEESTNNNSSGIVSTVTAEERKEIFVRRESRNILLLRLIVILVLLVAAVAVSILVHSITSNGEEDSFEANYNAAAEKVTGKHDSYCSFTQHHMAEFLLTLSFSALFSFKCFDG